MASLCLRLPSVSFQPCSVFGEESVSSSKPVVLFIGPTPPPYQGISVLTFHLLNSALAHEFCLVHIDTSDRRSMANSEHLDFSNVYLALLHGVRCWWNMLRHRPDVVYLPISQSALGFLRDSLFMVPARWFGAKLVIHLNGGAFARFYENAGALTRSMIRFCMHRVDLGIVLCEKFKGIFGDLLPAERVAIVENGLPDEFGEPLLSSKSTPRNKLQVVYLGTMMESKGFVDLVHAAPFVVREVPDVEFVLVGDGKGFPEYARAQAWVAERGIEEHVKFVGPKWGEGKKHALFNADIFCFPTWYPYEGQPLVIIEAMSAGLPVVTTRHAANEATLGEEGALYAKIKDPEDLAAQLVKLLKDPERRRQMGARNRQRFVELYTVDSFAANLAAAFNRVLGISSPTPSQAPQPNAA